MLGRLFAMYSKMRFCLRSVVQPQNRLHGGGQFGRKADATCPRAVLVPFMFVEIEPHLEGAQHVRGGSLQFHGSALGRYLAHRKVVFFGKLFDFFDCIAIGAMFCRELFT